MVVFVFVCLLSLLKPAKVRQLALIPPWVPSISRMEQDVAEKAQENEHPELKKAQQNRSTTLASEGFFGDCR